MAVRTLISAAMGATLLLAPMAAAADDPTAKELAEEAEDNLLDAESVHLTLTDRSADKETSRTEPTAMDLALDRSGNCVGVLEMGADGGAVEIVKQGDEVWLKPDTAFWKAQVPGGEGDAAAELFKNRWIHGSTDDALLKGMADTCDLKNFQRDVDSGTDSPGSVALKKGEETTRDGEDVIPLTGEVDGARTTLYVTSDTPHRLVEATQRGTDTNVRLTFSDYDEPVPSRTPSADDTVDVDRLQEELGSL
ncbi:hypothetical protein QNN03_14700 [Streptomyces sp. GXMU-J15]|uniref:Lipoprotein n=1 Tax=Streptomyces fuscus TaxID=3048495 RepID=A0ABT7J1P8_9ACTN|nr:MULTISPECIES: hypothetical protein [Streptomyces]MDL2077687.1 hypothetical protein [Streptomyces fuscus]SBT91913.1 hypothetical protein GA0115233_103721 [Streptomyces sp. DI166]